MQAAQKKIEYRSAAAPRKRVVKIQGNVAYIKPGAKSASLRGGKAGQAKKAGSAPVNKAASLRRPGSSVISAAAKQQLHKPGSPKSAALRGDRPGSPKSAALRGGKPGTAADKAKHTHTGAVSTIIVIFVAFCALALLVSRYAAVCVINGENNRIKSDISSLEAKIEELKVDIELQEDLEYVQDKAVNVLGMTYPDQVQRMNLDMS